MASSRKKLDEKHLKILRELGALPENRSCFDCQQRGPTYINMTIGSFVCTSCSGSLRGLNPPHRVKSISMASFTQEEIELIKSRGNQYCQAIWLGLYEPKLHAFPDSNDEHKLRDFMITKYEKKRFYVNPSVALKSFKMQSSSSGTSSTASSPSSENKASSGFAVSSASAPTVATAMVSVSKPSVALSQSAGSLNGTLKGNSVKTSNSAGLLSGLPSAAKPRGTAKNNEPFFSTSGNMATTSQESFANFENANFFTTTSHSSVPSTAPKANLPTTFTSTLTPLLPSTAGTTSSDMSKNSADRYAALKDLDEELKLQKEAEAKNVLSIPNGNSNGSAVYHPGTAMFGTSPVSKGVLFGTSGTANGGYSAAGQPVTTSQPWGTTNFSSPNPFSGNQVSTNPWSPAVSPFVTSSQSLSNPFAAAAAADMNLNQVTLPTNVVSGAASVNGTSTCWANFSEANTVTSSSASSITSPWTPSVNPFVNSQGVPTNTTIFNPFM